VSLRGSAGTGVFYGGLPGDTDPGLIANLVSDLRAEARAGGGQRATALKLTFAVSGLPTVLQAARSCPVPLRLNGSAGAGVLYGALAADTPVAAVAETVQRLRAVCEARGGALVVLDAPADVKHSVDTWGPVPALELMRRVKQQFDPGRRLAPGRFVGGI
jgi:glycolate oxidase FAD binding subunit